ncbi:MAG TPA: hypothetical protein VF175_01345 [Lacipirellula sp.]
MSDQPEKRRGPRFGLRLVFFMTTILALGLGYLALRSNWRLETARRHNLLMAQLVENLLQPARGVTYDSQQITKKYFDKYFASSWDERWGFFDLGNPARFNSQARTSHGFSIVAPRTGSHPADLCQRILAHYERDLKSVGLSPSIGTYSSDRCQTLWTDDGVVVIVEVWLEADRLKGTVHMLVVDDQEFHLW